MTLKIPLDDTIWGRSYGSVAAVRLAFDRIAPEYHKAIWASGAPQSAARALRPYLEPGWTGLDLGCGSGVLGMALREEGMLGPIDGLDVSPGMLRLAASTGHYLNLEEADLLETHANPAPVERYDYAVTVGPIGDYVPYYIALPFLVKMLKTGAPLGFAVEQRSTSHLALEQAMAELRFKLLAETTLPVPAGTLEAQTYQYYVVRLP